MDTFQYPKTKYQRRLTPRQFKRYQSYKRYLQHEFNRVCVYCRQPDSSAPNLNFGVDHYKPKGLVQFASLLTEYSNLYYCCGSCNSRKNNYWPKDEKKDPFIVAPCEHIMNKHLKFDAATGKISTLSKSGAYTEELLQLNEAAVVEYRNTTTLLIKMAQKEILQSKEQIKQISKAFKDGAINQVVHDQEIYELSQEIAVLERLLENTTGTKPTPPLPRTKMGLNMH